MIEHILGSKQGYIVPEEYSLDWMLYALAGGDVTVLEKLDNEYSTLETMKLMYFKQVKALKEIEHTKKDSSARRR